MTAEIALLNRSALALAADSAVTIRIGSEEKIYDSAEKIFELSKTQPIALMIYNNVEYVGVPLDVFIRQYRRKANFEFDRLSQAADAFMDHLECFPHTDDHEKKFFLNVLIDSYTIVQDSWIKWYRASLNKRGPNKKTSSLQAELGKIIDTEISIHSANVLPHYLTHISFADFEAKFGVVSDAASRHAMTVFPPSAPNRAKLRRLAFALMRSRSRSQIVTGLVFGGYGSRDLFPTLKYIEIDGIYFNRLKIISTNEVDIDRASMRAEMVPFAQKEMADRFIYGIDDEFRKEIAKFVSGAVDEITQTRPRTFTAAVKSTVKTVVEDSFEDLINNLRTSERKKILDILHFMSKKELAEMAYALVELTSKKRRFSTDQDTVGGPIDVAIVTKNEGFIWIRRKHYFSQEANPRFYARVFAQGGYRQGDTDGGEAG